MTDTTAPIITETLNLRLNKSIKDAICARYSDYLTAQLTLPTPPPGVVFRVKDNRLCVLSDDGKITAINSFVNDSEMTELLSPIFTDCYFSMLESEGVIDELIEMSDTLLEILPRQSYCYLRRDDKSPSKAYKMVMTPFIEGKIKARPELKDVLFIKTPQYSINNHQEPLELLALPIIKMSGLISEIPLLYQSTEKRIRDVKQLTAIAKSFSDEISASVHPKVSAARRLLDSMSTTRKLKECSPALYEFLPEELRVPQIVTL